MAAAGAGAVTAADTGGAAIGDGDRGDRGAARGISNCWANSDCASWICDCSRAVKSGRKLDTIGIAIGSAAGIATSNGVAASRRGSGDNRRRLGQFHGVRRHLLVEMKCQIGDRRNVTEQFTEGELDLLFLLDALCELPDDNSGSKPSSRKVTARSLVPSVSPDISLSKVSREVSRVRTRLERRVVLRRSWLCSHRQG